MSRSAPLMTRWVLIVVATVVVGVAFGAIGVPSAALFAALVVGVTYALTLAARSPLELPKRGITGAQAVIGVALGTSIDADTLAAVGGEWFPVLLVTVGTLVISIGAGLGLARTTGVDRPTASLGLIAGGASGIVTMADELGADGRLVAFMQYLRVLVVVLTAPFVAQLFTSGDGIAAAFGGPAGEGLGLDLLFTVGCVAAGLLLARLVRMTAGSLLAPLVVAAGLSISGLVGDARVPDLVQEVAFATIGIQVGLRFTLATLRQMGRLLPATLGWIVAMIAACAGLAGLLVPMAGVSYADAYLATTPGGLYAVLAASADMGGNVTFVVAVQTLRVFVMVLAAPPLVRLLIRGAAPARAPG